MPLVPISDDLGTTGGFSPELMRAPPASGVVPGNPWAAAFRQDNSIGSALSRQTGFTYDIDPTYDAWRDIQDTPYMDHWPRFANILNPADAELIKRQIDQEETDRRILASSGVVGWAASLVAAGLDWTTLLPGGAAYRSGKLGFSIGRTMLSTGVAAGAATVAQESLLQSSQLLRTTSESAINVGGSVILGGILGAGFARILNIGEFQRLSRQLEVESAAVLREASGTAPTLPRSASDTPLDTPDQVIQRALSDVVPSGEEGLRFLDQDGNTIAGRAARFLGRSVYFLNPLLRGLTSPSARYREIITNLLENSIYTTRNMAGGAAPVAIETQMKEWTRGALADVVLQQRDQFNLMRRAGINMSYQQFSDEVGRAIRAGTHPNPNIQAAAQYYTDHLFKPLLQQGLDAGLFPAGTTIDSVRNNFTRIWNTRVIERNEAEFRQIVSTWALEQADRTIAESRATNAAAIARVQAQLDETRSAATIRRSRSAGIPPNTPETTFINRDLFERAMDLAIEGETPPRPTSLTTFLQRAGGLVDEDGVLRRLGITGRTRPGFIRRVYRTDAKTGGITIDEAIELTYNGRFFDARPSRAEFLQALQDDFTGRRLHAHADEREAAQLYNLWFEIDNQMRLMNAAPEDFKSRRSRAATALLGRVNKAFDTRDAAMLTELEGRIRRLKNEQSELEKAIETEGGRDVFSKAVSDDIFNKVTGRVVGDETPFGIKLGRVGPLRETTFDIPHHLVDRFLVNDANIVAGRFARTMAADVGLKRRFGSVSLADVRQLVQEEYAGLRAKVAKGEDVEARQGTLDRLAKRERNDLRDLDNVVALLRGSFQRQHNNGNFARIAAVAQTWNFIRGLGGVVISSLTDITRHIMVHGLGRTMTQGLRPLIRNLKKDGGFRLAVKEARLAGAVGETILNSRLANWTEIMDPDSVITPVDRFMRNLSSGFSKVSGMVYWNDFQKSFASVITQNRILRDVATFSSLKQKERAYLAYLGIDEAMAKRIQAQATSAAQRRPDIAGTHDGVIVAGTEVWDDIGARQVFRAAVNKDVDSIIVTRGYGDVPVFANTPLGRILLQFRSFSLASHQRILMRGVQENHAGVYLGMVSAATIGMFIYVVRQLERGEEITDNPGRLLAEGIDRSGLLSIFMEVNNAAEQLGVPGLYRGAQAAFPNRSQQPPATRYAAETAASSIGGPTFGLAEDVAGLIGLPFREKVTEADVRAGARLLPGRNLPVLRSFFDQYIIPYLAETAQ